MTKEHDSPKMGSKTDDTKPKSNFIDKKLRWIFSSKLQVTFTGIAAVIVATLIVVIIPSPQTPIITINDGQVKGIIAYSREGKEYWQFLGIPYAQPPLGKLRFSPPLPAQKWESVKDVNKFPPYCVQFNAIVTQTTEGVEDCLFLNVFTHPFDRNESDSKRPVLVHMHGGGFLQSGSRDYEPDYFMDFEDVVLVTFNYRLGPLGFLNFEHDPSSDNVDLPRGNMGIKDQLLVLKWVQANIAHFNGDPNMVTIFGESAGGVSVHLHVLSPQSQGLFHRAMSQSGTAYCSWGFTTKPRETAYNYANKLNCPTENSRALLDCLENYDPWEMVKFQLSVTDPGLLKDNLSPSVESVIREDTFLQTSPSDIMKSGNFSRVPYILGVVSGDGSLRTARFEAIPSRINDMRTNWTQMLGNVLLFDHLPDSVANLAKAFYFGSQKDYSSLNSQSFLNALTNLFSDVFAFEPTERAALGHAKSGSSAYVYYYDYIPRMTPGLYSAFKAYSPEDYFPAEIKVLWTAVTDWIDEHLLGGKGAHQYGVTHNEDALQLWNVFGVSKLINWLEVEFSQSFVKTIVEFALGRNEVNFNGARWTSITCLRCNTSTADDITIPYMLIDNSLQGKMIPGPFASRLKFWESVGIYTFNKVSLVGNID